MNYKLLIFLIYIDIRHKKCITWLVWVNCFVCTCVHNNKSSICAGCENENPGRSSKLISTVLVFSIAGNSGCDKQNRVKFSSSIICLESVSSGRIYPSILPAITQDFYYIIYTHAYNSHTL